MTESTPGNDVPDSNGSADQQPTYNGDTEDHTSRN